MAQFLDLKADILERIKRQGGWVNCHAHLDRAYSLSPELFAQMNAAREEKWLLNKELRQTSTVTDIYERMAKGTEVLLSQGCYVTGSFIDVDEDVKDKAIQAAQKVREKYPEMTFKFQNQSSYGILTKAARQWFEVGADFVDIIGGLLKADAGHEAEHLDILLTAAKSRQKMVQVHVDENNISSETETEILAKKIIEHGMQHKVAGIHGISINAHPKAYREELYTLIKKAGLMFIACPMSWINARRQEELTPTHNPITPLDEMHPHGITVGLGLDNIADVFMAFNDANLWNDFRLLMECNRFYDIDELVKIATVNGRKILGLSESLA
jgi:cytosine/adenosine deaminase-related metal-dependent hydrolase